MQRHNAWRAGEHQPPPDRFPLAELRGRAGGELMTLPDVGEPVPGVELGDLIVREDAEQPLAVRFGDLGTAFAGGCRKLGA
jgi:hypothetical protein